MDKNRITSTFKVRNHFTLKIKIMKKFTIILICLSTFISCDKSFEILINPCRVCSYQDDKQKITEEVCDDTGSNVTQKEMEERMQREADALNVVLVCRNR